MPVARLACLERLTVTFKKGGFRPSAGAGRGPSRERLIDCGRGGRPGFYRRQGYHL